MTSRKKTIKPWQRRLLLAASWIYLIFANGLLAHEVVNLETSEDDTLVYVTEMKHLSFSPASLDFGEVEVGESALASLNVSNISTRVVTVSAAPLIAYGFSAEGVFTVHPHSTELAPGETIDLTVTFTPNQASELPAFIDFSVTHSGTSQPAVERYGEAQPVENLASFSSQEKIGETHGLMGSGVRTKNAAPRICEEKIQGVTLREAVITGGMTAVATGDQATITNGRLMVKDSLWHRHPEEDVLFGRLEMQCHCRASCENSAMIPSFYLSNWEHKGQEDFSGHRTPHKILTMAKETRVDDPRDDGDRVWGYGGLGATLLECREEDRFPWQTDKTCQKVTTTTSWNAGGTAGHPNGGLTFTYGSQKVLTEPLETRDFWGTAAWTCPACERLFQVTTELTGLQGRNPIEIFIEAKLHGRQWEPAGKLTYTNARINWPKKYPNKTEVRIIVNDERCAGNNAKVIDFAPHQEGSEIELDLACGATFSGKVIAEGDFGTAEEKGSAVVSLAFNEPHSPATREFINISEAGEHELASHIPEGVEWTWALEDSTSPCLECSLQPGSSPVEGTELSEDIDVRLVCEKKPEVDCGFNVTASLPSDSPVSRASVLLVANTPYGGLFSDVLELTRGSAVTFPEGLPDDSSFDVQTVSALSDNPAEPKGFCNTVSGTINGADYDVTLGCSTTAISGCPSPNPNGGDCKEEEIQDIVDRPEDFTGGSLCTVTVDVTSSTCDGITCQGNECEGQDICVRRTISATCPRLLGPPLELRGPSVGVDAGLEGATISGRHTIRGFVETETELLSLDFFVDHQPITLEDFTFDGFAFEGVLDTTVMSEGPHTFAVRARNEQWSTFPGFNFVVQNEPQGYDEAICADAGPPVLSVSPGIGGIVDVGMVTISGLTSGLAAATTRVVIDGELVGVFETSAWSLTHDFGPGSHSMTVSAESLCLDETVLDYEILASDICDGDSTAPTSNMEPSSGSIVTPGIVTFSGWTQDPSGRVTTEVELEGTPVFGSAESTWSTALDLAEGSHNLKVTVRDGCGNGTFKNYTVHAVHDAGNCEPGVDYVDLLVDAGNAHAGVPMTLGVNVSDADPIDRAEFSVDGQVFHVDGAPPFSAEWTPLAATPLVNDRPRVAVEVFDECGFSRSDGRIVTVQEHPGCLTSLVFTTSSSRDVVLGDAAALRVGAVGGLGVEAVDFYVDGEFLSTDTFGGDGFEAVFHPDSIGTHLVSAEAVDPVCGETFQAQTSFEVIESTCTEGVDSITIDTPADGATFSVGDTVTFQATARDADGLTLTGFSGPIWMLNGEGIGGTTTQTTHADGSVTFAKTHTLERGASFPMALRFSVSDACSTGTHGGSAEVRIHVNP